MRSFTFIDRKLFLAVFLSSFAFFNLWAQCPNPNTFQLQHLGTGAAGITPATVDDPVFAHGTWAGHFVTVHVVAGEKYELSMLGTEQRLSEQFGHVNNGFPAGAPFPNISFKRPQVDHDPMITVYDNTGSISGFQLSGNVLAFNEDASATEPLPELEFTASYTGEIYVAVDLQPGTIAYNAGLGPPNVQFPSAPADCGQLFQDSTSLKVTRLAPTPSFSSATLDNSTQITTTFSKNVQTNGANPTDFTVVDGIGTNFAVSSQTDGTAGDTDIVLTMADVSSGIGDLIVTYTNNNNEIRDFDTGLEFATTGSVSIDTDNSPPTLVSATKDSDTQISVSLSEPVQTNATNPTDFTVVDGLGTGYAVSAQTDGSVNDAIIVLTIADLSSAVGDLTLTYTNSNDEITDFGNNSLATDGTGVNIDSDTSTPTLSSAAKDNNTQITVTFNEFVQTNGTNPTDFTVTDGLGTDFPVGTQADGTAEDPDIVLTVADLSTAVGDLTVTYTNNNGEITDFGGNEAATDGTGVLIDTDNTSPTLSGASKDSETQITVTLSEAVQTNEMNPTDFTVQDGVGTGFTVSAQADGTSEDSDVVLTVANLSSAIGDLTVTYTNNNDEIRDFGGNSLANDAMGVVIDTDMSAPTMVSAQGAGGTQITITFNEPVQTNETNPTDFTVMDGGATNYPVSAQMDGTANDNQLILTVADFSGATGTLTLTYTNNNSEVRDFGNNDLVTDGTGVNVSVNPALVSATKDTDTQITLTYDQNVQTNETNPMDFTVVDGQATAFLVGAQVDGTGGDTDIVLTVADISSAVGDIIITYTNNNNEISDAATGTQFALTDVTGVTIDLDSSVPTLVSATKDSEIQISVTMSEAVQTNGTNPTDFTVVDGLGTDFAVSSQVDGAGNDAIIILTVADLSMAVGDLTVTYTNNNDEITDFGSNSLATDATGVSIDTDTTAPTLSGATKDSDTQITLTLSESVQTNEMNPTDFSIKDGAGNDFAVSAQSDGSAEDAEVVLTVADLSSALGDLTITYTNNNDEVTDFGGNSLATDATGIAIDLDTTPPGLNSASKDSDTQITLTLSEVVQTNEMNPTDFTVVDGAGTGFAVGAQTDGTAEDAEIELTVADLSAAIGDLKVTYTNNNTEVSDFGSNVLATDNTGVSIDTDASAPTIASAIKDSDTQIRLTFNEPVQTNAGNPTDFIVTDAIGTVFTVTAQGDGTAVDNQLVLTVADMSSAVATLTVTYTNNNTEVSDFGGNALATDASGANILLPGNFRIQWNANNSENRGQNLTIFTDSDLTYDYNIVWGDGSFDSNQSGNISHTYAADGDYVITIEGTFPRFTVGTSNEDQLGYNSLLEWGNQPWANLDSTFLGAENLVYNATDAPNLMNVNSLVATFQTARMIGSPDLSNWDVSGISNMTTVFAGATSFNGNITTWNVGAVTDFEGMFAGATSFNQDISGWNVSNATTLRSMFARNFLFADNFGNTSQAFSFIFNESLEMSFNQNIESWNVASVTDMSHTFDSNDAFNQPLNGWNVSSVTTMEQMFEGADVFNQDLNSWDVSNVTNMDTMFGSMDAFDGDISNWDVSNVTTMSDMFDDAEVFNQDISSWDVSSVTNMFDMFEDTDLFNQDIGGWNVSNVTDMAGMFEDAMSFNQDISGWNVSNVTDMDFMFRRATVFNQPIGSWNVSAVTQMEGMFEGTVVFNQDISNWNVSSVTTMEAMFSGNQAFNQPIGAWNVSSVETMTEMFKESQVFNQDISGWNVAALEDAEEFLDDAVAFRQVNWDKALIAWASLTTLEEASISATVGHCTSATARQTLIDTHGWEISDEGLDCAPTLASAEVIDNTTIEVTFNEALNTNEGNPTDFTVTDAAGATYAVSAQVDGTDNDSKITLTVADLSSSSGTLTVTYTNNNNNELFDDAFNYVATDATGVTAPDVINPSLESGDRDSETQLTISFNEPVTTAGVNPGDFTVVDSNNTNFPVTGLSDGTSGDNDLVLTLSGGIGSAEVSLTVTYTANNANEVEDIAGNDLATDGTGISISLAPIVTAVNVSPNNAAIGDQLEVQITFSRAVDITGSPTIEVTIGSTTITASTSATTNATQVNFTYTILEGEEDTDGIALASAIVLNGGTIIDSDNSLTAILDLENVEDLSDNLVDGIRPTLSITSIADDTGDSSTDLITNDNSLFVNGTSSEASQQVTLSVDGTEAPGTPVTDSNGNWQFSPIGEGEFTLSEGVHTISATVEDAFENESSSVSITVTVDQTAPEAPVISTLSDDTGDSDSDELTNDTGLTFSGTAEANSTLTLSINDAEVGTADVDVNGSWTLDASSDFTFTEGSHTVTATTTDVAGNTSSTSADFDVTIDLTAPATPTITGISEDTGANDDELTSDTTPAIAGNTEANSTVEVFLDDTSMGTAMADANGDWSLTYSGEVLADGVYTLTVAASDEAGNTSSTGGDLDITIDTTAPEAPEVTGVSPDSGSSSNDGVTQNTSLTITGTAEASGTIEVFIGETSIGTTAVDTNGDWSLDHSGTSLDEGTYSISAKTTDVAGNEGTSSESLSLVVDTTTPQAPELILSASSDLGQSDTDNLTADATPTFSGTAESNAVIEVFVDDTSTGTASADENGNWSFTLSTSLANGERAISATATDAAGNTSTVGEALIITIDRTFSISSLSPADNEVDVLPNVSLSVTFDEDIFLGTGSLQIRQVSDDEVVESIDVTSSQVTISGATASIDPSVSILPPDTELYVTIEAGTFQNSAGADYAGVADNTTWSFTIIPAPVVTGVTVPMDDTYIVGENLEFTVSFTLPVFISGSPSIPVTIGETAVEAVLSGTVSNSNTATFRYSVTEGDLDIDGIGIGGRLSLNGGSIQDEANVDAILNLFSVGATANVRIDGVLPDAAFVTGISDDTGRSTTDMETSDGELIYSGTAESNGTVALFIDGTGLGTANVDDSGNWNYDATDSALAEGSYSITTRVTDAAGNTGAESDSFVVIVDQSTPEIPIVDLSPSSDNGISDSDNLTNDAVIVLQGTAEANSTVTVTTPVGEQTTTAAADGNWTLDTGESLDEGNYDYTATATDVAGNVSLTSEVLSIEVDLSMEIVTTAPAAGETDVVINESLLFTFDQNINKASGNLEIYLDDDNSLVESIDVMDSRVLVDGPMILFNPVSLLAPEASTFYVLMDEGILTNDAGYPFVGINSATTYRFATIGDSDQDGVIDLDEDADNNGELDDDTDGDGTPDYLDIDDDGDGLLTSLEDLNSDGDLFNEDTDRDGIPNFRDSDDDGDGIETIDEDFNRDGDYGDDNDNDGIPDYLDDAIIPDEENIPQGLSPDGDGANDIWRLPEIESHPNNRVSIFNRWGSLVFETTGYDNANNAFTGASNSGSLPGADILPDGTYYYVVDFGDGTIRKGFLVIKQ